LAKRQETHRLAAVKRVPLPLVLVLCVAVVVASFLYWTKDMNFMKEPSAAELEKVREHTLATVPARSSLFNVPAPIPKKEGEPAEITPAPVEPAAPKKPKIMPGDVSADPIVLDAFSDYKSEGAEAFIELAAYLEDQGRSVWALLAWERIIDQVKAQPAQLEAAITGVKRTKPGVKPWNTDPEQSVSVTLEISVPNKTPKAAVDEIAETACRDLGEISSGILTFRAKVSVRNRSDKSKKFSLKVVNGSKGATGSYILDQMPEAADEIRFQTLLGVHKLIESQISAIPGFNPPPMPPMTAGADLKAEMNARITRLIWKKIAESLLPKPAPPAAPTEH
jgi:hypothetical protein